MLPEHCKDVAVKEVSFDLTEENISNNIKGKCAYTDVNIMSCVTEMIQQF